MDKTHNQKAVAAILAEYKNVIIALQRVIDGVSFADLTTIVDTTTANSDCQSIQTIVTHIVSSGYAYCGYIRKLRKKTDERPGKILRLSVTEYCNDLDLLVEYTQETFADICDEDLEEFEHHRKMLTSWGQVYDIEQMMEHAIVHVLRHRRQIEKFKRKLDF